MQLVQRILIGDGPWGVLKTSEVSREMLASELRAANVAHLGQLRRVYLESCGSISLAWRKHERPGSTVWPDMECSLLDAMGIGGAIAAEAESRREDGMKPLKRTTKPL